MTRLRAGVLGALLALTITTAVGAFALPSESTLSTELTACRLLTDARARGWTYVEARLPLAAARCRDLVVHWDGWLRR